MLQQSQPTTLEELTKRIQRENVHARTVSRWMVRLAVGCVLWCGILLLPSGSYRAYSPLWPLLIATCLVGLSPESFRSRRRRKALAEAIGPLGLFQERAALGTLLRFRQTLIFTTDEECRLQALCVRPLHRLVPRATVDELERLDETECRELVALTYLTLGPHLVRTRLLGGTRADNVANISFGIALFLALATLRQPGAEKSARFVLEHYADERLREAAQEYLWSRTSSC